MDEYLVIQLPLNAQDIARLEALLANAGAFVVAALNVPSPYGSANSKLGDDAPRPVQDCITPNEMLAEERQQGITQSATGNWRPSGRNHRHKIRAA
jgi:hypothetical protein